MTLWEVFTEIEGKQHIIEQETEMFAHFFAAAANSQFYKKPIKGKDLYGKRNIISIEERQARFDRAVKLMGPDVIPIKRDRTS